MGWILGGCQGRVGDSFLFRQAFDVSKEDQVETIIGILFAHLRQFHTPAYVDSPGPYLPGLVSQIWSKMENEIATTRRELMAIKEYELKAGANYCSPPDG